MQAITLTEIRELLKQLIQHGGRRWLGKPLDHRRILIYQLIGSPLPVDRNASLSAYHLCEMMQSPRTAADEADIRILGPGHRIGLFRSRNTGLKQHI